MRYMLLHKVDGPDYYDEGVMPPADFIERMDDFLAETNKAGVLLAGEGLRHPKYTTRLVHKSGKTSVTDGPYAEAKEVIAGFVIVDVKGKDEAIAWGQRFADCFGDIDVEVVVRPVSEGPNDQTPV